MKMSGFAISEAELLEGQKYNDECVRLRKLGVGRPPKDGQQNRERIDVRLPPQMVAWLKRNGTTQIIETAIKERMDKMDETRLTKLAHEIYTITDGADHRTHKADTVQAIYEWLAEGDVSDTDTADSLAGEWMEYNK